MQWIILFCFLIIMIFAHLLSKHTCPFFIVLSIAMQYLILFIVTFGAIHLIEFISSARFFLTIVDYYKHVTLVYLTSHKSKTHHLLQYFIKLVTNQFDQKVKKVWSNNGKEFAMTSLFQENDVFHQTSYMDTP